MNKNREPYSKEKFITILVIECVAFILSFALLFVAAVLQSKGFELKIYAPFGASFFLIITADMFFSIYHYSDLKECEKNIKKQRKEKLEIWDNINLDIDKQLQINNYKLRDGYYFKRRFSIYKDFISFYIKQITTDDIANTLEIELDNIEKTNFNGRYQCFVCLLNKEYITDTDVNVLKNISKEYISFEIVHDSVAINMIVVLIESNRKRSFIVPSRYISSLYYAGYKQVKKILTKKKS